MRGLTRDGTLRIATAVMIAAMAVHVVHDLLRLRVQPALPLDGLGETTCFAAMIAGAVASCTRRRTNRPAQPFSVVAPLAVTFIALAIVLAVVFAPLRDLYLAADGVLACCGEMGGGRLGASRTSSGGENRNHAAAVTKVDVDLIVGRVHVDDRDRRT